MADEQIKPVDQVAAGGTAQPANPAGIIDALRSRGPMPQSALSNIMQPPGGLMGMSGMMLPPPPAPANLGLAAGSGMLAGLQGRPNTNPYLTQHADQQDADYKRQQDMLRMQERMQAQREKQSEAVLTVADGLLQSDNPEARQSGAQTKAALYKSIYGFDTKPEYWTKRIELSGAERDRVDALLSAGVSPQDISTVVPKLAQMPPGWLESEKRMLGNPGVRRALGLKSQEALELEGLDESSKLKLAKDRVSAQDRVDRGVGSARDLVILGAKSVDELVDAAITQSIVTGQPIPPDMIPYMKSRQRELQLKGYTGKMRAAMEAAGGDPVKALEIFNRNTKASAADVKFGHYVELERLRTKERSGQRLTQGEQIQKNALEGYLAGKGGGGDETVTSTEKRVPIKPEDLPVLQGSVDEITGRLTGQRLLPNDKSPYVVIQGQNVPKTRILEREYERTHPGWKVSIQWNPTNGKFEVVDRVQTTSTTRTKGPVRSGPLAPQPAQSDDSDEEDN